MPKSRSRPRGRPRTASQRYRLDPDRKQRHKKSPRWYGPAVLTVMAIGVAVIVSNYMQLLPGSDPTPKNSYLWMGLALIAIGFAGTTRWR